MNISNFNFHAKASVVPTHVHDQWLFNTLGQVKIAVNVDYFKHNVGPSVKTDIHAYLIRQLRELER